MSSTKPGSKLSFHDRLSRLTFEQACKLLGPQGRRLIQNGGRREIALKEHVYLGGDLLRVRFPSVGNAEDVVATLTLKSEARDRLHWNCTICDEPCEHVGSLLSCVLENKLQLGLAAPPKERTPIESLAEPALVREAIAQRAERAKSERMKIRSSEPARPWTDYLVTSALSGKTYRVALRG
ncbi:MAG: helicase, partial [Planctomycetaceae bacterium]